MERVIERRLSLGSSNIVGFAMPALNSFTRKSGTFSIACGIILGLAASLFSGRDRYFIQKDGVHALGRTHRRRISTGCETG